MLSSKKTVILFTSPQCILHRCNNIIEKLIALKLIHFVVVDEIHLFNHFGRSFRKEFTALKESIFQKIENHNTPILLMTATCTQEIRKSIEKMIGITITNTHWPGAKNMKHRKISLDLHYTNQALAYVLKSIKQPITSNEELGNKVIIYSNSAKGIVDYANRLGNEFDNDDDLHNIDIVTITGRMKREQKAEYLRTFLDENIQGNDINLRVLCSTSGVGNAGIDSPDIRAVYRIEFPPSVVDICQERGRAGRRSDALPTTHWYKLLFSLESFLYLFKRIHDPQEKDLSNDYRAILLNDLLAVTGFICSNRCYVLQLEEKMGNPFVKYESSTEDSCGFCTNCIGKKNFPILQKQSTCNMLFDLFVAGDNKIDVEYTYENVMEAIVNYPSINKVLFGSRQTKIEPVKIKKFILLMIGSSIIKLKYREKDDQVMFELTTSSEENFSLAMNDEFCWKYIHTK